MDIVNVRNKHDLTDYFEDRIETLDCQKLTKAYILDLLVKYLTDTTDLANRSLTFAYYDAVENQSFEQFQSLGDWMLYHKSLFPDSFQAAADNYYDSIARSSYYKCYVLMRKKWLIYEELADQFSYLTTQINQSFYSTDEGASILSCPRLF